MPAPTTRFSMRRPRQKSSLGGDQRDRRSLGREHIWGMTGIGRLSVAVTVGLCWVCLPSTAFVVPMSATMGIHGNVGCAIAGETVQGRRLTVRDVSMVATGPRRYVGSEPRITVSPARTPGEEGPHLPWQQSMAGPEFPLNYMPFMEHMLNVLAESFGTMTATPVADRLAFAENKDKRARILSMAFTSPEIRKVRLTYFDAGEDVQVLNAVIYPDLSLDMPIFGVDLISFGKKNLAGMDFQPLFDDEPYRARITRCLGPIKARYPEFAQKMSARFYDSAKFFSEEMLFARFEDRALIDSRLFPAFKEYLSTYVASLKTAVQGGGSSGGVDSSMEGRAQVLDRQRAYDQYNAERDPAHGLFVKYFGEGWSNAFMDDFLFALSVRPEGGYPKGPKGSGQGAPPSGRPHSQEQKGSRQGQGQVSKDG